MVASEFLRAAIATGKHYFTGPKDRVNDAAPKEYPTLTWLHRGQDPKAMVKRVGAFQLTDKILLSITPRMKWTDVSTPSTATLTENGANHSFYWRLAQNNYVRDIYVDEHNQHVRVTEDGGAQQFEDYIMDRLQEVDTDTNNFQEASYWSVPNFIEQETSAQAGLPCYSIMAHINEFTNGMPTSIFPGGAWTQFQGITTSEPGFSHYIPQRRSYSNLTKDHPDNVISGLDYLFEYLRFVPPPTKAEYYEPESKAGPGCIIFTDIKGKMQLKQLARASHDKWENPTDAYWGDPTFGGVPIVCPPSLETVQAFPTGTAGALGAMQTTTAGVGGSRYFLVNAKYYSSVYDGDWYMRQVPGVDPQFPLREIMYVYTGWNNFNRSPRRHGCLYPSENIAAA
jgi:hypothetical protein